MAILKYKKLQKINLPDEDIAYRLTLREFQCRCRNPECVEVLFSSRLHTSWNEARKAFKLPLKVNSGFRCLIHNKAVGGKPNSFHTKGEAIDISFVEHPKLQRERLHKILKEEFDVVLVYASFFHCHNLPEAGE